MASRIQWTKEEEDQIRSLIEFQGVKSWKLIAQKLNKEFSHIERSGKQCRERYTNYIRFSGSEPKAVSWTSEEDQLLTNLYLEYGAKWTSIIEHIPQKSQNSLKNRFYGGLRRLIRKINKIQCTYKMRKSKPLRYESLLRILEYNISTKAIEAQPSEKAIELDIYLRYIKECMLKVCWDILNGDVQDHKIVTLIKDIHNFNSIVRNPASFSGKQIMNIDQKMTGIEFLEQKDKKNFESKPCSETESDLEHRNPVLFKTLCCSQPVEAKIHDKFEVKVGEIQQDMADCLLSTNNFQDADELDILVSSIFQTQYTPLCFNFFE